MTSLIIVFAYKFTILLMVIHFKYKVNNASELVTHRFIGYLEKVRFLQTVLGFYRPWLKYFLGLKLKQERPPSSKPLDLNQVAAS